jgi:hypothetical protein
MHKLAMAPDFEACAQAHFTHVCSISIHRGLGVLNHLLIVENLLGQTCSA